mmetsp:Transcript_43699/g.88390  ORF Transcript_43699/g.88390 Transcript_43699/m.88390 type:complete len:228 (-) Transcript_43699:1470-2153(-)
MSVSSWRAVTGSVRLVSEAFARSEAYSAAMYSRASSVIVGSSFFAKWMYFFKNALHSTPSGSSSTPSSSESPPPPPAAPPFLLRTRPPLLLPLPYMTGCSLSHTCVCLGPSPSLVSSARSHMPVESASGSMYVPGLRYWWPESTCWEILRSVSALAESSTTNKRSKRDKSESGRPMLSCGRLSLLYCPYTGFAAASTEQRAFKVAWIPALATVTVCCSITSWMAVRS